MGTVIKNRGTSCVGVRKTGTTLIHVSTVMGTLYYDTCEKKWKVYVNNERGRHRIRLITENEEEAFDDLLSIVNFEVENNRYI